LIKKKRLLNGERILIGWGDLLRHFYQGSVAEEMLGEKRTTKFCNYDKNGLGWKRLPGTNTLAY
jgi:hypothetical protein